MKKLTDNKVREILRDYKSGDYTINMLVDRHGIKYHVIRDIILNKTYKHITRD